MAYFIVERIFAITWVFINSDKIIHQHLPPYTSFQEGEESSPCQTSLAGLRHAQ